MYKSQQEAMTSNELTSTAKRAGAVLYMYVYMYMTETSQCICRSLIHELLLGDAPYKFNPFPPSKVELNDVLYIL